MKFEEGKNIHDIRDFERERILDVLIEDPAMSSAKEAETVAQRMASEMWAGKLVDLTGLSPESMRALSTRNAQILDMVRENHSAKVRSKEEASKRVGRLRKQDEAERVAHMERAADDLRADWEPTKVDEPDPLGLKHEHAGIWELKDLHEGMSAEERIETSRQKERERLAKHFMLSPEDEAKLSPDEPTIMLAQRSKQKPKSLIERARGLFG